MLHLLIPEIDLKPRRLGVTARPRGVHAKAQVADLRLAAVDCVDELLFGIRPKAADNRELSASEHCINKIKRVRHLYQESWVKDWSRGGYGSVA
ncbi:MAG: hypothetical protein AAFX65_10745 [Cyanobacteria bacterium J06638_7]